MFRVECMCGAELEVSEASSGNSMRVNPHECKGWQGWVDQFDKNMEKIAQAAAHNTGTRPDA